jgi:hypothetical protein
MNSEEFIAKGSLECGDVKKPRNKKKYRNIIGMHIENKRLDRKHS